MCLIFIPNVNFINVLRAHFSYKILAPKIKKLSFGFQIFCRQSFVQKMHVMKLTAALLSSSILYV